MMCRIIRLVLWLAVCITCIKCQSQGIEGQATSVEDLTKIYVHNFSSENGKLQSENEGAIETTNQLSPAQITGLRVEDSSKPVSYENGVSVILAESEAKIRLFGISITENTAIRFTTEEMPEGSVCGMLAVLLCSPLN